MFYILPFIVPPGSRDVAGDFHRPYGGSEDFTFYRSSGGGDGSDIEKAAISDIRLYPLGEMWYNGRKTLRKAAGGWVYAHQESDL